MRSFGLTKRDLLTPFLFWGFFIAGPIFVLNSSLIPHSRTLFKNMIITITSRGNLTNIKAGQFFIEIPRVTLFVEKVSDDGNRFEDVFILQKKENLEQVIMAKKGALIKQPVGELRAPTLRFHLEEGNILKQEGNDKLEKILFDEYDFPVVDGGDLPGIVTKDSMRSNDDLRRVIHDRKEELSHLLRKTTINSDNQNRINSLKKDLSESELEYWSRLNAPIQVLLFIFLGFSIGIKKGRGHTNNSGPLGLFFLIGYYILFFGGMSLAKKVILHASIAVFLPTILSFFLGIYFFRKLDWQS